VHGLASAQGLEEILQALGGRGRGRPRGRQAKPKRGADVEYHLTLEFLQAARGVTTSIRFQHEKGGSGTINVKIPPGVREGSKVRVRGKGQQAPGGAGDLYIITHVREHPYFRRVGNDVYVDLPISAGEAVLGAKVDVPTIDGMTTVSIPAGTSGSRRLRLRERGIPSADDSARGDQYVQVKIVVPSSVSEKGAELMRRFDASEKYDPRANVPWKK